MTDKQRKNYYTGSMTSPSTKKSAASIKGRADMLAVPELPPKPTTVKAALAQLLAADKAWRKETAENSERGRLGIRSLLLGRRSDAVSNLLDLLDPTRQDAEDL